MELYLIRHTTPDISSGICYGQSDIPLKETFEMEWQAVKEKLPKKPVAIYTSPLKRCLNLALKIQNHIDALLIKDDRLMEMNFGDWELKNWNDINQSELNAWMKNYHTVRCPDGECYNDVLGRVQAFLESVKQVNGVVIVVTHAGVIKIAHSLLNPGDLKSPFDFKVTYGGIYRYDID